MSRSAAVEAALDVLGLLDRLPEPGLLNELHRRFAARVPYQDPGGGGRTADEVLEGFAAEGTGAAGLERTRAFVALARGAGFEARGVPARLPDGRRHAAILLGRERGLVLAVPGLPLPVLLEVDPPSRDVPSALGALSLVVAGSGGEGLAVEVEARAERKELLRVELAPLQDEALAPGGAFDEPDPGTPALVRHLDDRTLTWSSGLLVVEDPWSRLVAPLPATDRDALEALFDQPLPPFVAAVPGLPGADVAAQLEVFSADAADPGDLLDLLRAPETFLSLAPPGTRAEGRAPADDGWSWRLLDEAGKLVREERVVLLQDGLRAEATSGEWPFVERTYRIAPAGRGAAGSRVALSATFARPLPPRGLPEGTRKTLVFHLVSELFALARLPG